MTIWKYGRKVFMTYEFFLMQLEESIVKKLHKDESVKRVQVLKNNGIRLDGFCYRTEGHREQPTVYVNQYYQEGIGEEELREIAEFVLKIQRNSSLKKEMDLSQVLDYEKMESQIYYRLISREKNEELLKDVPWIPWLDLAIVFYLKIPEHILEHATALIHMSHMEHWGVSIRKLHRTAVENMNRLPVHIEPMECILEGYGMELPHSGMHVLSCGGREFGASAIVNPRILKKCFQRLGENYYVLPSSIHEVILVPESLASDRKELDALIQEVNTLCVSREDYLSSHAYFYSSEIGQLK